MEAVLREWQERISTLLVLPTGCGKTICFADIVRRVQPLKCVVLAHREELIFQAQKKIAAVTGLDVQVEMADYRAEMAGLYGGPQVVVSTIQTHCAGGDGGRMTKFNPEEFGVLVIDEAHHATADTYRRSTGRRSTSRRACGTTSTGSRATAAGSRTRASTCGARAQRGIWA